MMQAFIVRPFGTKQNIDFDKVEEALIIPALKKAGIKGSTTAAILEAGNIREDMFHQLLTADLVIADLSIHNANVFYELGIRHALRDKRTFLIRCSKDEIPFDLKTDRYLNYQADNPADTVEALAAGIKATILSDRQDSPVFLMLPKLEAQKTEKFLPVPNDFGEEVAIARVSKQIGKLALLAYEAEGFSWQIPGLRSIGEVQYYLKAFEDARETWEKIRKYNPDDLEANELLATIYQRLAETALQKDKTAGLEQLAKSDLAINLLQNNILTLNSNKRAEIYALKARNAKTRWINSWKDLPAETQRKEALQSSFLKDSFQNYERGYLENLNHFYSGINALGLLTILISLAEDLPEVWELIYSSTEEATDALKKYKVQHQKLCTVIQVAIEAEKQKLHQQGESDPWLNITEADLNCIILTKPERVASMYRRAIQSGNDLNFDAAQRQLRLYEQLQVLPENVKAALAEFTIPEKHIETKTSHYLLFTGHMIDKPDRTETRFPPAQESTARAAIKEAVLKEIEKSNGPILGIAGGACGGDILFHEVCEELNIPTELYLALPREQFLQESVQFAGPAWVERFDRLYKKLPTIVLAQTKEMPKWLQKKQNYTIWERNNLWMLHSALVNGGLQMTLIALWNRKGGDAAGGTEHMVQEAQLRGAKTIILDTNKLFAFANKT